MLCDLIAHANGETGPFVPLHQAAAQLGLTLGESRWQFYVLTVRSLGTEPVVRPGDVAWYARWTDAGRDGGYASAIERALLSGPWRELGWRGRAYLFNERLPPALQLNWRTLHRIAAGHDRELARAIRVLAALRERLGVEWRALLVGSREKAIGSREEGAGSR